MRRQLGGLPPVIPALTPIPQASRVLFSGDSITKGYRAGVGDDVTYRWSAPLEAWMTTQFTNAGKTPPTYLNTAVTGQQTQALYADLNAQVISQTPDRVFLCIGTNDIGFGRALEETRDKLHAIIADTVAALPGCKFYVLSLLLDEEKFPKGANVGAPPLSGDGPFDIRNAALLAGLTGLSTVTQWLYLRDSLFTWEAQYNLTNAASGYLTQDGVHMTKAGTGLGPVSGAEVVSSLVQSAISLNLT